MAMVAGLVALVQRVKRDASRQAQLEALVGRIATLRPVQRDTAALLAVEAYRLADTPATRALLATFTADPASSTLATCRRTATCGSRGDARRRARLPHDARSPYPVLRPRHGSGRRAWPSMSDHPLRYSELFVSSDNRTLVQLADNVDASGSTRSKSGSTTSLRNAAISRRRHRSHTRRAAVSPDGSIVAVSGGVNHQVTLLSSVDGHRLGQVAFASGEEDGSDGAAPGWHSSPTANSPSGSPDGPIRILSVPSLDVVATIKRAGRHDRPPAPGRRRDRHLRVRCGRRGSCRRAVDNRALVAPRP